MKKVLYRTECNQRSKYFADISEAYIHFHVCMAKRKSAELWLMEKTVTSGGDVTAVQTYIDRADFKEEERHVN